MKKSILVLLSLFNLSMFFAAVPEVQNPVPFKSRSENLDLIFSTDSLAESVITIKRTEWNQMLTNYDYFFKNENLVNIESFELKKGNYKWVLPGGGLRLRGNTSRFKPQGKDTPTDFTGHVQKNEDWSQDYYAYAKNCSDNDYRQSHFKVDFSFGDKEPESSFLADCMKGVALKRMDASCAREIFCYDLFHRYGIWTAPRACHTRVFIHIIEPNGTTTKLNYGVYEMFEEVGQESLKARTKKEIKQDKAWEKANGFLWKSSQGDLADPEVDFGCEKNKITEFDEMGKPVAFEEITPVYDLKTQKNKLDEATEKLKKFIIDLNGLPDAKNENDKDAINKIKDFYEKNMDVDFFLKTYAVNILVGMDDDYWGNANNYYLYFVDGKVYLIPFDYDNTLGCSIAGDPLDPKNPEGIKQNPLEWGRGKNRPLMDKLLQVPEYKEKFRSLLLEVCDENSEWDFEKCSKRFLGYKKMVEPYLDSPDLDGHISTKWWGDYSWRPGGVTLTSKQNNIFDFTRKHIRKNLGYKSSREEKTKELTISVNEKAGKKEKGISLKIANIPSNAFVRQIYVNGKLVADKNGDELIVKGKKWNFPYVQPGNKYVVQVVYLNNMWQRISDADPVEVTPSTGLGEITIPNKNDLSWSVKDGKFRMNMQPEILLDGKPINTKEVPLLYIDTQSTDWQIWARLVSANKGIEIPEFDTGKAFEAYYGSKYKDMENKLLEREFMVRLYYYVNNNSKTGPIIIPLFETNPGLVFGFSN